MNIAHIVCVFPPYRGGIGKSALDFSEMMALKNHNVDVLTPARTDISTNKINSFDKEHKNIRIKRIKHLFSLGNGAFMPRLFLELKKYDLIYLHYPFFGGAELVWFFSLFNKKAKIILHYHMDVLGLSPLLRVLSIPSKIVEKRLLKRADLITAGSFDYIENSKIGDFYKKNKSKFRETFFPVDVNKFFPAPKEEVNVKQILFVGGLDKAHYFKGLNVLIDALAILNRRKDWRLVIVGSGELEKDYINKCRGNNIIDRVCFRGSLSEDKLSEVYRESDFFVLPSVNKGEAFGIVLLEAMSSGLPVLASRLAGVRSVFREQDGYLLKPGDKNDLMGKIEYLLDNPEILKKKSISAREYTLNKYSYEKISKRVNQIIEEL